MSDEPKHPPPSLDEFVSVLMRLPVAVREYLGSALLDSVTDEDESAIDEEAHRRAMEMERGEVAGVDADDVIASLRAREREADVDALVGRRSPSAVGGIPAGRRGDAGLR